MSFWIVACSPIFGKISGGFVLDIPVMFGRILHWSYLVVTFPSLGAFQLLFQLP